MSGFPTGGVSNTNATEIRDVPVDSTAPTINGQVLAYDPATGRWSPVNTALGGEATVPAYLFNSLPVSTPGSSTSGGITTETDVGTVTITVAIGNGLAYDGATHAVKLALIGWPHAGRSGAGTLALTGAGFKVGDRLISAAPIYGTGLPAADPQFSITGNDQITQGSAADLSGITFNFLIALTP